MFGREGVLGWNSADNIPSALAPLLLPHGTVTETEILCSHGIPLHHLRIVQLVQSTSVVG